jgi:hypothetical protein
MNFLKRNFINYYNIGYLTTLDVANTAERQTVGSLVNTKLEGIWK